MLQWGVNKSLGGTYTVKLKDFSGFLPISSSFKEISLSDATGQFLKIQDTKISFNLLRVFSLNNILSDLSVDTIDLKRMPHSENEETISEPTMWGDLIKTIASQQYAKNVHFKKVYTPYFQNIAPFFDVHLNQRGGQQVLTVKGSGKDYHFEKIVHLKVDKNKALVKGYFNNTGKGIAHHLFPSLPNVPINTNFIIETGDLEKVIPSLKGSVTLDLKGEGTYPLTFSLDDRQTFQMDGHFKNLAFKNQYLKKIIGNNLILKAKGSLKKKTFIEDFLLKTSKNVMKISSDYKGGKILIKASADLKHIYDQKDTTVLSATLQGDPTLENMSAFLDLKSTLVPLRKINIQFKEGDISASIIGRKKKKIFEGQFSHKKSILKGKGTFKVKTLKPYGDLLKKTVEGKIKGDIVIDHYDLLALKGVLTTHFNFSKLRINNIYMDEGKSTLSLKDDEGSLTLHTKPDGQSTFDLDCLINVSAQTLRLQKLILLYGKHALKLINSPILRLKGCSDLIQIKASNGGYLSISDLCFPLNEEQKYWSGLLKVRHFPLHSLQSFFPRFIFNGFLRGQVILSGEELLPLVKGALTADDLSLKTKWDEKVKGYEAPLLNLVTNFGWDGKKISLKVGIKGKGEDKKIVNLNLFQTIFYDAAQRDFKGIKGSLKGNLDLSLFKPLLISGDLIKGQLNTNISLKGSMEKPLVTGAIHLSKGFYENAQTGTQLRNLTIDLTSKNNRFRVNQFRALDHKKGVLSGKGVVKIHPNLIPESDISLKFDKFQLVNCDAYQGNASGILNIKGKGLKTAFEGDVNVHDLKLFLEYLPISNMADLIIRQEKGFNANKTEGFNKPKSYKEFFPLSIKVKVPKSMMMQGFGVESKWDGSIALEDYLSKVNIVGDLKAYEGILSLFGKKLELKGSHILFNEKDPIMPILNFEAYKKIEQNRYILGIKGKANDPTFVFRSEPAMPEDYVLSYILFDQSPKEITLAQSLKLAAAASRFGKQGLGFVDGLRQTFGLDSLELTESEDPTDKGKTNRAISIGKRVGKVRLSIDQGLDGEDKQTKAKIEVPIMDSVTAHLETGNQSGSGLGLTWSKRYY